MKRELEAKSGPTRAKAAQGIILAILLCVSGSAAHAQRRSTQKDWGPSSHYGRNRSSTTTTVTPPSITTQPASATVLAGGTASFSVAASGTAPLAYQWYENGMAIGGATSSTYTIFATTTSYNGAQFSATVSNSGGTATSNAALLTVNSATLLLNSSSKSLAFGDVSVSSSSSQSLLLTNAGNSSVTISNVSVAGAGFNAGGGLSGIILSPGQTATLSATFAPATAGSVTGGITVTSNASNSPAVIALSGTGVAPVTHSVLLSWAPSTSSVTGYNVYSSEISGGPYSKLTTSPVGATSYTDTSVTAAQTYYYVVTAVSSTS
ncbi:MAG TPA: DUF1573 domain-containing protein, partial [Candidatus Acidoferrales bacterium]